MPEIDIESALLLVEESEARLAAGEHAAALEALGIAIGAFAAEDGPDHPDVGNLLMLRSRIERDQGDLAAAEASARRAVEILDHEDWPEIVVEMRSQALRALGGLLRDAGRYAEARPWLDKALAVARGLGPLHPEVPAAHNELGMLGKYDGRFDDGQAHYDAAVPLIAEIHGERSDAMATLCHNLGGIEHARGRPERAEAPARRALEIRQSLHGPDDVRVAADAAALAPVLQELGRFEEAEALYHRALRIFEGHYGPEHYEIAVNLANLAVLEQRRGDVGKSERLYRRAVALHEARLGPDHPDVGLAMNNLATLLAESGRQGEADGLFARALVVLEASLGPDHPDVAAVRENRAAFGDGGRSSQ